MNTVLMTNWKKDYTLIARNGEKQGGAFPYNNPIEFVVAYKFDVMDGTWKQGYYFQTLLSAIEFMNK